MAKSTPHDFVPSMTRPHVVILGSGATRAAFPNGEGSGKRLPIMNDLSDIVGLDDILIRAGIPPTANIEDAYSSLKQQPELSAFAAELEAKIHAYFESLQLPPEPTLYDYLVLSLRPKDVIATFNWDPLLAQACMRNVRFVQPPRVLFLHGNVAMALCLDCEIVRPRGSSCSGCGRTPEPIPLLYPIKEKDYASNPFIAREWEAIRGALRAAYILTIFGYSAPASDLEAIELLREGWGRAAERNLEEIELIDIKPHDELRDTWRAFIHTDHYRVNESFYSSWTASFPRRTCEAMWARLMEHMWLEGYGLPSNASWEEVRSWYGQLVAQENEDF